MAKGLLVTGIVLLLIGLVVGVIFYGQSQACDTAGSQIENVFDEGSASNCGMYDVLTYVGFALAIIGVVVLVFGLASRK